ncbi:MAG: hypothetical protein Q7S04_03555 [Candidatus Moranbacteria bacterium]|nr:hypothetical protein [Candidatus Moranbacteria bacterium]
MWRVKNITRFSALLFFVFFYFLSSPSASATTTVSGVLLGSATWTKANGPYLVREVTVPVGATLTIEPGTVVKLSGVSALYAFGTITIGAPDAEKVIITSFADDTVGGDTNNNGSATVPTRFDWCSIGAHTKGIINITNTSIRYGGCSVYGQVYNFGGTITITDSQFLDSGQYGILNASGKLTLTSSEVTGAEYGVRFHSGTITMRDNSIHDNTAYSLINTSLAHTVIDATNNWWGDATGPWHLTNINGLGNKVSNYVIFNPWLGSDPSQKIDLCAENCFSSVLFLPGLEASRLYTDAGRVWEPQSDTDAEKLYLDSDGKSVRGDISTKDVIDNAYVPVKGNIYQSFLADLDRWKNTDGLIADYVVAPYDWRLSLDDILNNGKKTGENISYTEATASPYIIEELRRLASTSKSGKVTLIAHSNGGLVAKALVSKLGAEAAELIDKIVFVAVPQSGTPQAIGAILHGYDQGLPVNWFPFAMAPKTARTLAQNMPSVYNLLPSSAYFSGSGSGTTTPVVTFEDGALTDTFIGKYGKKIDTASELNDFLVDTDGKVAADSSDTVSPSRVNPGLLLGGKNAHQSLDDLVIPAAISVYQIAGFGEETLGTIKYWTGKECLHVGGKICSSRVPKLEYTPELIIDGDGTVVAPSALAMSTSSSNISRWWVDLFRYGDDNIIGRKHASILEVFELRDFIKDNILTQSVTTLPKYISDSEPPISSEKRLRYFLHSPLALSAHDDAGNEISASIATIPGAEYRRFGEVQYVSLPAASHPTVVLDGQEDGSFTLEVQEVTGDTVTATTTFSGIPSSADTQATMDFSDGTIADASALTVDYDGNGTADFSLEPSPGETVLFDITPPVTTASVTGTTGTNDWYMSDVSITLTAQDEANGSGVAETTYSLDNGVNWRTYTAPVVISQEGATSILYASTDKQGNKEDIKTESVKIDKTAPEGKIVFNPLTQKLDIIGTDNLSKNVSVTTMESVVPSVVPSERLGEEKETKESDREGKDVRIKSVTSITDEAGHATILTLVMSKDRERRILRSVESISYDGVLNLIANTALQYKWNLEKKKNTYSMFASNMRTVSKTIESHYLPKKNITIIMQKPINLDERDEDSDVESRPVKEKLSGMIIPGLITEKGSVKVNY